MRENLKFVSLAGAIIMALSLAMPWAKFKLNINGLSEPLIYGWEAGGFLFAGMAVLIAVLAFIKRPWSIFPALFAASFVITRLYDFWSGGILKNAITTQSFPKFGVYVAIIGVAISIIAAIPGKGKVEGEAKEVPISA